MGRQIRAAALLARLDEHHAVGKCPARSCKLLEGEKRGEECVAVVGGAATEEEVATPDRREWVEPW